MRKLLFPILIVLTATVGCLIAPPVSNQPPTAYIDLVSPVNAAPGEVVTFRGYGTDSDGSIAAYDWRSSADGDLSNAASFQTSSLSPGTHTIWFRVQDDKGEWSKEVSATVVVIPGAAGKPIVNSFEANPGQIGPDGSATLSWNVSGAATVSIDQQIGNVALNGTMVVLPSTTMTYTLTAENGVGTVTATAKVVVAGTVSTHRVELYSIAAEDGLVARSGSVGQEPRVGDVLNSDSQAFLSFDISMIPKDAAITSAALDLTAATNYDDPFTGLGELFVYDYRYRTLTNRDYVMGLLPEALIAIPVTPSYPVTSAALAAAVQERVDAGSSRFQLRLQFQRTLCCGRRGGGYVALGDGKTRLIVDYQE
jgi:hypothetical protein